jgi:hypothetical protein
LEEENNHFLDFMPQMKEELNKTKTFYNQLQEIVHKTNKNNYILLSADTNARIGMLKSIILYEVLENKLKILVD